MKQKNILPQLVCVSHIDFKLWLNGLLFLWILANEFRKWKQRGTGEEEEVEKQSVFQTTHSIAYLDFNRLLEI